MSYKIQTKGKFLFIALSSISLILLMALTTILWWLITKALHNISPTMALIILSILRIFYLSVICGIVILFLECYTNISIKYFHKLIRFTVTFLFPLNVFLGKFLLINKDKIRESFIKVNNSFIKTNKLKLRGKDILILLPHCLQNYYCQNRITNQIDNCVDCGKCAITHLKQFSKQYGTKIAIATGGTLARKIIVSTKPRCIIAVACQRDLVDGLLEVFPIPVYGVLNERPEGPCINTTVNTKEIDQFLNHFIEKE